MRCCRSGRPDASLDRGRSPPQKRAKQGAMPRQMRAVKISIQHGEAHPSRQQKTERGRVTRCRARIRERARIDVNTEREQRRLDRIDQNFCRRDSLHQKRRRRACPLHDSRRRGQIVVGSGVVIINMHQKRRIPSKRALAKRGISAEPAFATDIDNNKPAYLFEIHLANGQRDEPVFVER